MARCYHCGTIILGGKVGKLRFCNDSCYRNFLLKVNEQLFSKESVTKYVRTVYEGNCPKCKKRNNFIDIYTSYAVYSFILITRWKSNPQICCRSCGVKLLTKGALFSFFFGWWGIYGILITPIYFTRNLAGIIILYSKSRKSQPSNKLVNQLKINLAAHELQMSGDQAHIQRVVRSIQHHKSI